MLGAGNSGNKKPEGVLFFFNNLSTVVTKLPVVEDVFVDSFASPAFEAEVAKPAIDKYVVLLSIVGINSVVEDNSPYGNSASIIIAEGS